jgi:DNA-binding transcriptional ArsR family regulator
MYERLAGRAELDLPPPPLWLLARLGERTPLTAPQLEEQLDGDDRQFESELEELGKRGLVYIENDGTITLTTAGRAGRLSELLSGWEPEQHRELEELVERLARDLASEIPKDPRIASGR